VIPGSSDSPAGSHRTGALAEAGGAMHSRLLGCTQTKGKSDKKQVQSRQKKKKKK